MSRARQFEIFRRFFIFTLAFGSLGVKCDAIPPNRSVLPCDSGVAQIMIWDARIQKICGCGGVDGEFAPAGTSLTCTFSLGKTLFFSYRGPFLQHQIVPVGTPAIPPGPIFDPNARLPLRSHAVTPTATGTYLFEDEFDHTISGSIVVTP